jgi:hypothetical protein
MTVYDLDLASSASIKDGAFRFFYLKDGSAVARYGGCIATCDANTGFFSREATRLEGLGTIWIYELAPFGSTLIQEPRISIVLSRRVALEFGPPWLLRADRIESTSGSVTPRHTHRGPGIRRLLYGRLLAEMGDDLARIKEGDAWFETGKDPIVGTNISGGNSAFVRVMVLPIELHGGKSSFVPTTAEEASKPRLVTNALFGEAIVDQ